MYLNLIQIAESFGVSEKVIEGWIRDEGLPCTPDRGRVLFDRAQVTQWAATRGLAARAGFLAPETQAFANGCRIAPLLRAGRIWRDVTPGDVPAVLDDVLAQLPGITRPVCQLLSQRLRAPGGLTIAPVGNGFALPHPSTRVALGRDSGAVALILLKSGLEIAEPTVDETPVTRLLFFIAPSPRAHLDLLGRLSRLLAAGDFRTLIDTGANDEAILGAVAAADAAATGGASREAKA